MTVHHEGQYHLTTTEFESDGARRMSANVNDELFDGGPLLRWERSLRLVKPGRRLAGRRTLLAVLIAWVPLAVLTAVRLLFSGDESAGTFFSDFAVHARFLIAVPALIYAEQECIPRLGKIVSHFADSGLVVERDKARFRAAVASTRRLLDSTISDVVTVVLVYLAVAAVALYFATDAVPPWHRQGSSGLRLSPAGWWHALVSLPLLLIIFLGWLWRVALWTRFLFLMSRLDLHLIPGHPDRVGGLKFVSASLRGFRLVSFALGAVVAGSIANRQLHQGSQPLDFKNLVIGLMVFLVVLFAGPLTIFLKQLREIKRRGVFEYGGLARTVGTEFEAKWIKASVDQTSLEVQDFSATTDLYSIVHNVYEMRELPFTLRDLLGPIGVSAMLPFLPLALLSMPMDVIFKGLVKLLF
jgi:hypothetical protein